MGCVPQILLMIFIIILRLPSPLNAAHISDSLSNIAYSPEIDFNDGVQNLIEKVSGDDENEEEEHKKIFLFEKLRVLLGLRSFHLRSLSNGEDSKYVSPTLTPSPSPLPSSEAEPRSSGYSPSPAPVRQIHVHPHYGKQGLHSLHQPHKIQREGDKGKVRRVLMAVLVSIGAATLVCLVGLIWACKKYKKHQKKPKRRMSVYGKRRGRSKCVSFPKPASKVSLNPGLDLFYLDSLGKDLEQQPPQPSSCIKQACETLDISSLNHVIPKREESVQESIQKSEFDNVSSSSTGEITSVHDDANSVNNDYDCLTSPSHSHSPSGDKIVPIESHSSDDESFHSFGESNLSNVVRLSNASLGSFSDALENFNSNEQHKSHCLLPSSVNSAIKSSIPAQNSSLALNLESQSNEEHDKRQTVTCSSICQTNLTTPPPPPPPPPLPPPRVNFFPSHSSSRSTGIESKASGSSTLPKISSSKESNSLSGSKKTFQVNNLASSPGNPSKPSTSPPGIPLPPCPPPFFKPNNSSLKTPPPPPSQLPQFSPLGKDGTVLPKLKPLHWDKVRATPDRTMVWDKLRSSSFE